jgi:hypothetical protein
MVVCAVRYEPVSKDRSLITGENTGKIAVWDAVRPEIAWKPLFHGHFLEICAPELTGTQPALNRQK